MRNVRLLIWTVVFVVQFFSATPEVIIRPRQPHVDVGEAVFLNCSTPDPSKGISWSYYPTYEANRTFIYLRGSMEPAYKNRARLDIHNDTGAFNLVIYDVQPSDAGRYVCQEEREQGQQGTVDLVVIYGNRVCRSTKNLEDLIDASDCGIPRTQVDLSCTYIYYGNADAFIGWKMIKENDIGVGEIRPTSENKGNISAIMELQTIKQKDTLFGQINSKIKGKNVTEFLIVKAEGSKDGSAYFCHTKTTGADQSYKHNCTAGVFRIRYALKQDLKVIASVGDRIVCSAKANVPCDYKWKWFKGDEETTESLNATLIPTKLGTYKCEAACNIKSHKCTVLSMTVLVGVESSSSEKNFGKVLGIVIAVVIAVSSWFQRW